jgi:RNA polymerase sigma factor (sigma-70 family)
VKIGDYNKCVDEHADKVYRFILKNIKNEAKAQDIVQDAFLRLWEKHKTIDAAKARSYLFTTAYHCMIDILRRDKKIELQETHLLEAQTSEMVSPDFQEILHKALDLLPEIQRHVVLLRDYEGYSYDEIGEICKLKPSQVKVYIYRARIRLKEYIGKPEMVL